MKKLSVLISVILAILCSFSFFGCDSENVNYIEYESAFTEVEHLTKLNYYADKTYSQLKEYNLLEDYKVHIIYNIKGEPQFFLIELIGLMDLPNGFDDEKYPNVYLGDYDITNYDNISDENMPQEDRDRMKETQLSVEKAINAGVEKINCQIFGVIYQDQYLYYSGLYDLNLYLEETDDDFPESGYGEKIKSIPFHFFLEEMEKNQTYFMYYRVKIKHYVNFNLFKYTHFVEKDSTEPNLLTLSEYKDKKIYCGIDRDTLYFGYEDGGEIYSLTDMPKSEESEKDGIEIAPYKQKISKENYQHLRLYNYLPNSYGEPFKESVFDTQRQYFYIQGSKLVPIDKN